MTKTEVEFKKNLIYLRTLKNVSVYEAADESGIDKAYLYRLEDFDKHQNLTFETLEKLADYYEIEVSELFKKQYD